MYSLHCMLPQSTEDMCARSSLAQAPPACSLRSQWPAAAAVWWSSTVTRAPPPQAVWQRKGVMQFHHAHTFRGPVVEMLQAEMPDVLGDLVAAGDSRRRGTADGPARCAAVSEDDLRPGAAERGGERATRSRWPPAMPTDSCVSGGRRRRRRGRRRDPWQPICVVDASGRASRFTSSGCARLPTGGDCGATYVTRQYELHAAASAGPVNSPIGLTLSLPGYWAIAFVHDNRTVSSRHHP